MFALGAFLGIGTVVELSWLDLNGFLTGYSSRTSETGECHNAKRENHLLIRTERMRIRPVGSGEVRRSGWDGSRAGRWNSQRMNRGGDAGETPAYTGTMSMRKVS
jgi:hypothetical protein